LLVVDAKKRSLPDSRLANLAWLTGVVSKILNYIKPYFANWELFLQELDSLKESYFRELDPVCPNVPYLTSVRNKRDVNTILTYSKRSYYKFDDLYLNEFEKWCDNELRLETLDFPSDLLADLNKIAKKYLKNLSFKDIVPRHGPGAISEGGRAIFNHSLAKYSTCCNDRKIKIALNLSHASFRQDLFGEEVLAPRISRGIFVPKNWKQLRGVNPEPGLMMFWQQGVKNALYSYMHRHPILGKVINLQDQSQNRDYAQFGSKFRCYDTIDLSSASDTISWRLVKAIFKDTSLYPWLLATRTDSTKLKFPDGEEFVVPHLSKYAPMGSALTFPIESLVFCFCAFYVIEKAQSVYKFTDLQTEIVSSLSIYGDDIVIKHDYYAPLLLTLKTLGFLPNEEKSFSGSHPFRESCGIECHLGEDITPMSYGRTFKGLPITFEQPVKVDGKTLSQLYSKANIAKCYGYKMLYLYWLDKIENAYYWDRGRKHSVKIAFTSTPDSSSALYLSRFEACQLDSYLSRYGLAVRYNSDLQYPEVKTTKIISSSYASTRSLLNKGVLVKERRDDTWPSSHYTAISVNSDLGQLGVLDSLLKLEKSPEYTLGYKPEIPSPALVEGWIPLYSLQI
jgi:hypothetical protein